MPNLPPSVPSAELSTSLALLHRRLDRELVARLDADPVGFADALLAHLRRRDPRVTLFDAQRLPEIDRLAERYDPGEWAWERRIADEAVAGRVYAATHARAERFVPYPAGFDFTRFEHVDPQAIMGLCRHRWYASLARAYWRDQDPRYFATLMREWDFFCERVPFPDDAFCGRMQAIGSDWSVMRNPPHMELDLFIRLTHWYWAFWLVVPAPEMTGDRCAVLLARALRQFDVVAARGVKDKRHNFTAMQFEGLYLWASALPEATGMNTWRHACRNTLESSLDEAVWSDGMQWEMSPSYHVGCIRWYTLPALLGRRQGEPFAAEYCRRLRAMGEAADAWQCPDLCDPNLSDGDRTRWGLQSLAIVRTLFPDFTTRRPLAPSYLSLWMSGGTTWEPASTVSAKPRVTVLPQGGLAIATSDPGPTATHAILDNGPNRAGHAHFDNLSLYWEAFGRPTLVDPGRYLYVADEKRVWVNHPESHNLTCPETPTSAHEAFRTVAAIRLIERTDDPGIEGVTATDCGTHFRLAGGHRAFRVDPDAWLRRTVFASADALHPWVVVVDRIDGPRRHDWTTSWLLPTAEALRSVPGGWTAALPGGLNLRLTTLGFDEGDARDELRFWSPSYGEVEPARWFRLTAACSRGVRVCAWSAALGTPAPAPELAWRDDDTLQFTLEGLDRISLTESERAGT